MQHKESYEIIWEKLLPELENSISTIHYTTFIKKLVPIDLVGTTLVLLANNTINSGMAKTLLVDKILSSSNKLSLGINSIDIFVGKNRDEYVAQVESKKEDNNLESLPLNQQFTFENFVVGESNRYLYAAAKAVSEDPGNSYNPLFIYGASGLGKTHIMHSIANEIKKTMPNKKIVYSTCEKFTSELIANIRSGKAYSQEGVEFKNKYRNIDVLIVDDVQFLSGKPATQEEFFHTFNALYGENKQIVLSADCDPSEIEVLDNRLKTRFEGGLKAQVTAPDLETKIAILQKKAEIKKHILTLDVATFIAENSGDNVRSLEGLLNKVVFASILHEKPITLSLATDALKDSISQEVKETTTTSEVIEKVCAYYGVKKSDLIGKKRNKELVEPRQVCAYLMWELMSIPLVTIGQALGGKNYATIIHSRDKIAEMIKSDDKLATEVNDIKNMILKK